MDNLLFVKNIILSYNWNSVLASSIIQLYLKSNNFSDIYYFENKTMLLNDLDSDYKINQKINNFNALGENINYYDIKIINVL